MIDKSDPSKFAAFVNQAELRQQPNAFHSSQIEDRGDRHDAAGQPLVNIPPGCERRPGNRSTTRLPLPAAFIAAPYHDVKVTDPHQVRQRDDDRSTMQWFAGTSDGSPRTCADVFLDDGLRDMGFAPKLGLDGRGLLAQMCQECHNSNLDMGVNRARISSSINWTTMSRRRRSTLAIKRLMSRPEHAPSYAASALPDGDRLRARADRARAGAVTVPPRATTLAGAAPATMVGVCFGLALAFASGCSWSSALPPSDDAGTRAPVTGGHAGAIDAGVAAPSAPSAPPAPPVDASALDAGPAAMLSAGGQHTCAVNAAGGLWCWGSNVDAQLASATAVASLVPLQISIAAGSRAVAVAAGGVHTCALFQSAAPGTTASEVLCWGNDSHGQLGAAGAAMTPTPVTVPHLAPGVTAIAAGGFHSCALAGGQVSCWGDGAEGQLGAGTFADSASPVAVAGLTGATALTAGGTHTCAITAGGGVSCWGLNEYGQLGDGTTTNRATPVAVAGLAGIVAISAGNLHTCALTSGGQVSCWGFGFFGQLGNNAIASSAVPVTVTGVSGASAIAAGGMHTCALATGGAVSCWGDDQSGQLGDNGGTDSPVPVAVSGLAPGAVALTAGTAHTCAMFTGGAAQCWGWNVRGQLGDDTGDDSATPASVCGL